MVKKYYDEFGKLPLAKMAQSISDMTYSYRETKVPTAHYKKLLDKSFEEVIESNISINLVDTYFKTLKTLHDENPKWFMQALLCLDVRVRPSSIKANEYQALELTYAKFLEDSAKHVAPAYISMFEDIRDNGATYNLE
ncbi:hypothetical protein AALT52_00645 [Ligilactobacillus faecis]|uniref:Uncharacterized protein n=1 Tax=Ligilactobacillus faecis TaxID=762833 RepID=A0ABV4DLP8_9LACO